MTLVPITYKGGIYQHDIITDLIEDLGGYIIQKHVIAAEVVLQCFVPREDIDLIRQLAKPLFGEVTDTPLVGTEIAIVSMSLEIHHLPHPSCDIAEYVRRIGAKSNMVSLARGPGKRIAGLNDEERDVINEHDIAVYLMGNFESCIEYKMPTLRRGIEVPIVLCGGPDKETLKKIIDPPVDGYVGNVGRFMRRTKESDEIDKLDEIIAEIIRVLEKKREEIQKDPLSVSPARLMGLINEKGARHTRCHLTYSPYRTVGRASGQACPTIHSPRSSGCSRSKTALSLVTCLKLFLHGCGIISW